jgi:hypothetical protein
MGERSWCPATGPAQIFHPLGVELLWSFTYAQTDHAFPDLIAHIPDETRPLEGLVTL